MKNKTHILSIILLTLAALLIVAGIAIASNQSTIYLPIGFNNYCPDFFDDFSNPSSGWYVGDTELAGYYYSNGEYRIITVNDQYIIDSYAPTCARDNYTIDVDARWMERSGESYGVIFGSKVDSDQFYLYVVNSDYQEFRLLYFDGGDYQTIVPYTYSPYINFSTASNRMKVTRNGFEITLEVNGNVLGTWIDANITGNTYSGIYSMAYLGYEISDSRFDNFSITSFISEDLPTPTSTPTPAPTLTPTPNVFIAGFNPSTNPQNDYVTINNDSTGSVDMTGWWMKAESESGRYDFPTGYILDAGNTVNLRSGVGTNTSTNLYIGLPFSLWTISNNCAYLRDNSDNLVDNLCVNQPTPTPNPSECLSPNFHGQDFYVCFTDIDYNPTSSPLDEWVTIKNLGNSAIEMEGWRIVSDSSTSFKYEFPIYTLSSGQTVIVYTKVGTNSSSQLYMNQTQEFWKDNKDCGYLKNDSRQTINSFCYSITGLSETIEK